MFPPFGRKTTSKISETSPEAMRDFMRKVSGKVSVGEREPVRMARAQRRINALLPDNLKLTERRARGYWNAEYETVNPLHAAAAKDVVSVLPVEEAIDAISEQIERHKAHIAALRESRAGLVRSYRGDNVHGASAHSAGRADVVARSKITNPATPPGGLTSSHNDHLLAGT